MDEPETKLGGHAVFRYSTCRSISYFRRTVSRPIAQRSSAFFPEHARKT